MSSRRGAGVNQPPLYQAPGVLARIWRTLRGSMRDIDVPCGTKSSNLLCSARSSAASSAYTMAERR